MTAITKQPEMVRTAAEAGELVLAGPDAGMVDHGIVSQEIEGLVEAGAAPQMALGTGSRMARRYLGVSGYRRRGTC